MLEDGSHFGVASLCHGPGLAQEGAHGPQRQHEREAPRDLAAHSRREVVDQAQRRGRAEHRVAGQHQVVVAQPLYGAEGAEEVEVGDS